MNNSLIILDRDGVINGHLYKDGLPDSPMDIDEVFIFPWVASALQELQTIGFQFAMATNQPAAAKGKVSEKKLLEINNYIVSQLPVPFVSVQICLHRAEDNCECRKPKTKMLENALATQKFDMLTSWMVGDRATDVLAGRKLGLNTALFGPSVLSDVTLLFTELNVYPTYYGADLRDFVEYCSKQYA